MSCGKCERLEEYNKLIAYLKEKKYDFSTRQVSTGIYFGGKPVHEMEMNTIKVNESPDKSWTAICSIGSYGYELGLLEVKGIPEGADDVTGFLTADDVIEIIEKEKGTINEK